MDKDKILHVIQRKVLKNTHLSVEIKEIQAAYLHSPYFKDLYQYLPEECVDKIITMYHKSLFVGHQGVIKMYLTISNKFLFPI